MVQLTQTVTTAAGLDAAIYNVDTLSQAGTVGAYTIDIAAGITLTNGLTNDLYAVNLGTGSSLTIDGGGNTIDGGGSYNGLFAYQGILNVDSLTIADARAVGGAGGSALDAGGGGAGLGGGLFIGSLASVGLFDIGFVNDSATGGAGGTSNSTLGVGGGGGLGGAGGSTLNGEGGGGGVGIGAYGGGTVSNGGGGILPGASAGAAGHTTNGGGGGTGGASAGGGGVGSLPTGTLTAFGYGGGGGTGAAGDKGGFGGGGGGFTEVVLSGTTTAPGYTGGTGGFGGGGGGSTSAGGGGGFGGGGGGAYATGQGGKGGFGGGGGGGGDGFYNNGTSVGGGGGGGGLGAGGDIFIQRGGTLVIHAGSLGVGGASGGASGGGSAGGGEGYGGGIFIDGYTTIALDPGVGQTLTVAGTIADEDGSAPPPVPSIGRGGLLVEGGGTVSFGTVNTYTDGTDVTQGTTLNIAGARTPFVKPDFITTVGSDSGAGSGPFDINDAAELRVAGPIPNTITVFGGVLDDTSLGYTSGASYSLGGGSLTLGSGGSSDVFSVGSAVAGPFVVASDGAGGTELLSQTMTVTDDLGLNAAIREVDLASQALGTTAAGFTIDLANSVTLTNALTNDLAGVYLGSGSTLTIDGGGNTLDGAGTYRGLFAYDGILNVASLTIADAHAVGGAGGEGYGGAGGGAGLGGGLFVANQAEVTLANVNFVDDAATGGAGGNAGLGTFGGGGGGLGGPGGNSSGGGGGVGSGAFGGTPPRKLIKAAEPATGIVKEAGAAGGPGILPGARSGGHAANSRGAGGPSGGGGGGGEGGGGGPGGKKGSSGGGGGFGGGGGGAFTAGSGGFGGGGGFGFHGGAGGFGGGGGAGTGGAGAGGFGAGSGAVGTSGGGGLGAGGDIFVQHGGVLVIQGGSLGAGSVAGGAGGSGAGATVDVKADLRVGSGGTGGAGSGFGTALFINRWDPVTLTPPDGQTLEIDGNIVDQAGAGGTGTDSASGTLIVDGLGTVVLNADNTPRLLGATAALALEEPTGGFTGRIRLDAGTLDLAAFGAAGTGPIEFGTLSDPVLEFAVANAPTNEIQQFHSGDAIVVTGFVATGSSYSNGTLTLSGGADPVSLDIPGHHLGYFLVTTDTIDNTTTVTTAPCFAQGTRIRTTRGEVAVEKLRVGDLVDVMLGDGPAPIVWIGRRRVDCRRHPNPGQVWPVRVARGAFGPRQPSRTLFLSPDHAVFVAPEARGARDGVLIPVKYLIDGDAIAQVPTDELTYFHVELARHDVLLSEGLPTETYLDTGDRDTFENGGASIRLHPQFAIRTWEAAGCAPLVITGPEVERARAVLASRLASRRRAAARRSRRTA